MRWFVGALIAVVFVAGVTAAAVDIAHRDPAPGTTTSLTSAPSSSSTSPPPPPEGQALVSGTLTGLIGDGVVLPQIPTPLSITTPAPGSGAGARIEGALIAGQPSTIQWDAGRPLELSGTGGGGLLLAPVHLEATTAGFTVLLDGEVHGFAPGEYLITTPVAVGTAGLAEPRDSVAFVADAATTVSFSGHATTALGPVELSMTGPGSLDLAGSFTVTTSAGPTPAIHLLFGPGRFELALTPAAEGFTMSATLEGPLVAS